MKKTTKKFKRFTHVIASILILAMFATSFAGLGIGTVDNKVWAATNGIVKGPNTPDCAPLKLQRLRLLTQC